MKTLTLLMLLALVSCQRTTIAPKDVSSALPLLKSNSTQTVDNSNVYISHENLQIGFSNYNACDNNVLYWAVGIFHVHTILNLNGGDYTSKTHVAFSDFKGGDENGNSLIVTGNQSFDEVWNFNLQGRDYYTQQYVIKFAVHSSTGADFTYITTLKTVINVDGTVKTSVYEEKMECK